MTRVDHTNQFGEVGHVVDETNCNVNSNSNINKPSGTTTATTAAATTKIFRFWIFHARTSTRLWAPPFIWGPKANAFQNTSSRHPTQGNTSKIMQIMRRPPGNSS